MQEQEYQHILNTIDRLTSVSDLAAYRLEIRQHHRDDPRLGQIEQVMNLRVYHLREYARNERRHG